MKCPKCQTDNPEVNQFCRKCGTKLVRICPQCAAESLPEDEFCGKCGHDLRAITASAPVDYTRPQTYTPKFLADKILSTGKSLEGERRLVTILFADVAGYTSMSEKLDPEEVHKIMEGCFQILMDEIHRYEGTITQFLGDGIMALFGAPIAHEDAPQRGLYAALGIRERIRGYARNLEKQSIEFSMHIGLNSGLVMVGRIGDDLTMQYTAMGDTVNLASRMGSMAEPGSILVTEDTYRLTEGYFDFKSLGEIQVKGRTEPVKAYELLRAGRAKTRLGVSVARGLTPFVGRKKELGYLMDCYERVEKGQGQVAGIVGEPGVGKSRLLLQLRETLPRDKYTYLEGECLHYGETVAYLPLLQILRCYFDIQEGEADLSAKRTMIERIRLLDQMLETLLPPLQDILSLKVEDEPYLKLDPQKKRERIFESMRNLLLRVSRDRCLVLGIENLQWIDPTSQEFLGQLVTSLAHRHIFLILLYRPEYSNPWTSKTYYSQISLDELPMDVSAEMVQAMLREGEAVAELKELVLTKAAGNPLFMEEFTRVLLEGGYIRRGDGHYVLSASPSEIQVPETIQGIIGARIDRLEDRVKQTLQAASVIGRNFSYPILQSITGAKEELKTHLADLQSQEFIYGESSFPEAEYTFKHALTQEVAYGGLLLRKRKAIHRKVAQAIEQSFADRLEEFCEEVAHHYSKAEEWEKALHYLTLSAQKAHRNHATREAFGYYRQTLGALGRLTETEENKRARIDITMSMLSVASALNFPEGSLGMLEEAQRVAEEVNDRSASVRLYSVIGLAHSYTGDSLEGLKYTGKAFEEAEKLEDESTACLAAVRLCGAYFLSGEVVQLADIASRAIAVVEKRQTTSQKGYVPQFDRYVVLLNLLGWARALLGNFNEGEKLCQRAVRYATEIRSQYSLAAAHTYSATVALYRGEPESLMVYARNAVRISEEAQIPLLLGSCWMLEAYGLYYQEDFATAKECVEKSISLMLQHGPAPNLSPAYALSGILSQAMGNLLEARRSLEQAVTVAHEHNAKHYEGHARFFLGRLLVEQYASQISAAEETIMEGLRMVEDLQVRPLLAWGHLLLGESYAIAGQREKALTSLNKAHEMCQEMGMDYWLARAEKALQELKG